jgi:hypothetical protein
MSDPADFDSPGSGTPSALPGGFRAAVTSTLTGMGYAVVGWEPDGVNVIAPDKDGEQYIGLTNLHRRARAAEKDEWPHMIREFLGHVTGAITGTQIPDDLTTIASRLRPRLGKPFTREGKAYPWGVPLPGTSLEINLVIDFPHTMAYVTDDMLAKSGKAGEDLLNLALANLRANTPPDFFDKVSEVLDIYVGHTGDGYDSARALLIDDLLPDSPAGFWVVIPSREELAVWPVSFDALAKIHVIKMFAEDNFREHAYPITNEVFWVWQGMWYPFGITIDDKNVTVSPPDEFMIALKELEGGCNESSDE